MRRKIENPEVAAVFKGYPSDVKAKLLFLRQLIFDVASETDGVGPLQEALKWGQPSYLTTQSQSGSLIRLDRVKADAGQYAMYFHCQTTLVDTFKELYRDKFEFVGNRSIVFRTDARIPVEELSHCISMALTYHLKKKQSRPQSVSQGRTRQHPGRTKAATRR